MRSGVARAAAVEARHAAVAHPQRPQHRHRPHDRLQLRRHRVLARSPPAAARSRSAGSRSRPAPRAPATACRRSASISRSASAAISASAAAWPGVRQHDAAPDQPGQRAQLRQPRRRQRPGAGQVALVRRQRAPEAVGAAAVEPLGQERSHAPPSAWRGARRARPPSPGRRRCRSAGSSPAPSPAPARRAAAVAERRQVVEPEAGLPLGLEPRVGRGRGPDRAAADRDRPPERAASAGRPAPRRAPASPRKTGSGIASATSGRPPSRARCAQIRFRQARGGRAIRSPRALSVRADRDGICGSDQ